VYNTFPLKNRRIDSRVHMEQRKTSFMMALFSVPALLSFSFWMFGTLVTMQFGYVSSLYIDSVDIVAIG
jgi:hypothetical protein